MGMKASPGTSKTGSGLLLVLLVLCGVLTVLFFQAFLPGHVLFSNDGPLGAQVMEAHRLPEILKGAWQDLNSIGFREAGASPNFAFGLLYVLGPYLYAKFYAPSGFWSLALASGAFSGNSVLHARSASSEPWRRL